MTKQVVKLFADSGYELFLFGSRSKILVETDRTIIEWFGRSRYAGLITPETDWDYAAQDSAEITNFLLGQGFVRKEVESYLDIFTTHVYERHLNGETIIQVSLKTNLKSFKEFWDWVTPHVYTNFLWKRGPNRPNHQLIQETIDNLYSMKVQANNKYMVDNNVLWE